MADLSKNTPLPNAPANCDLTSAPFSAEPGTALYYAMTRDGHMARMCEAAFMSERGAGGKFEKDRDVKYVRDKRGVFVVADRQEAPKS